ncbi:MAG TPA: HU family DNA-binding protein [Caulobacteraceae bacterium]|jgi:DNA-binding protein HU-beta|nr:HU family DNA-binding protein [Caulobacteraceae bacterium]
MPAAKKTAAKAPAAKAPAASSAAKPKVVTVSSKQIAAKLAENHDLSKKAVEAIMGDMTTMIIKHLKKGEKVRLGLGILQVRKRAARMGRNPATGEAIKIKASKKLAFRPAKEVKEAI